MSTIFGSTMPLLSIDKYAIETGITKRSVTEQMEKGQLPFVQHKKGGTRYINMVALFKLCEGAEAKKCAWNQTHNY